MAIVANVLVACALYVRQTVYVLYFGGQCGEITALGYSSMQWPGLFPPWHLEADGSRQVFGAPWS